MIKVRRIEELADRHGVSLPAAALQFALAHPSVVSVIPGFGSAALVAETVALLNAPIPDGCSDPGKRLMTSPPIIRLSPLDNVAVATRALSQGEKFPFGENELTISAPIALGHKVVISTLSVDDKVLKYGMPIGSMTDAAAPGDWIHIHNMRSDYLPAHQRDAAGDHS